MEDTRNREQLRRHFEVERELGSRLRNSTREERSELFKTLYSELFTRVPDHPRLVRRDTEAESRASVAAQMKLLKDFLVPGVTFVEFAPGDCRLSRAVAELAKRVIAADISDQRDAAETWPDNFELIVYDGYNLPIPAGAADLAFSYQFLEHVHPDDVPLHLEQAARILKQGGTYVLSTPHRFSGPHDISRYFSDVPEGFHLKEWTFAELGKVAIQAGFRNWHPYRSGRVRKDPLMKAATLISEWVFGLFPRKLQRRLSQRWFSSVTVALER
jgi:SAM-dependent methyltransferase